MENKYFTPDIEDIHVGYELVSNLEKLGLGVGRVPLRISKDNISHVLSNIDNYEVPYLNKEQIEAELKHDWKFSESTSTFKKKTIKENFILNINIYYNDFFKKLQVKVIEEYEEFNKLKKIEYSLFNGECKDINTFRKIIKLLGI